MNAPVKPPLPLRLSRSLAAINRHIASEPIASARRAEAARARQRNGARGEDVLEAHNAVCLRERIAAVMKIPTAMRIVGTISPGVFRAVFAKKVGVDYRGHMLDGSGRAVYVECKSVADPAAKFYLRDVSEKQREQLDAAIAAGCVAALVIVRGPQRELSVHAWERARTLVAIEVDEMRVRRVRPGDAYLAGWMR